MEGLGRGNSTIVMVKLRPKVTWFGQKQWSVINFKRNYHKSRVMCVITRWHPGPHMKIVFFTHFLLIIFWQWGIEDGYIPVFISNKKVVDGSAICLWKFGAEIHLKMHQYSVWHFNLPQKIMFSNFPDWNMNPHIWPCFHIFRMSTLRM